MIKFRINEPALSDLEKEYALDVIDQNWLSAGGKHTDDFENLVSSYLGVKYAIALQSGTAALHLALKAANVKKDDYVVIPNYSCGATISAVKQCNAIPIVIDIDPVTYSLDVNILEDVVKKYKIKALQFVHVYGFISKNTIEIASICRDNDIVLIEDAAEALGAKIGDTMAGSIGDISILSIRSEKMIGVGEGGVLLTSNENYYSAAMQLASRSAPFRTANSPYWDKYFYEGEGYNYRLPHLLGAIAKAQIERFEAEILPLKIKVGQSYRNIFKNYKNITLQKIINNSSPCYWLNSIVLKDNSKENVRKLGLYLESIGIEVRSGFWPLSNMQGFEPLVFGSQKNAETLYEKLLVLPSSSNLIKTDIEYISNTIISFLENNKNEK
jgi:perosamine synthetase